MAEGQGSVGLWAGEKALGGQESFLQEKRMTGSLVYAKDLDGKRHERVEGLELFPKGHVWNWGNTIHYSRRRASVVKSGG